MILLPIRYNQMDSRWGSHILGNNTDKTYDIYNFGCLLCCLAMVLKYYGVDTDPDRLNEQLKQDGGFAQSSGEYNWGSLVKVNNQISESNTVTPNLLTDQQIGEIKSAIDKGNPVIIQISYNPKVVKSTMHFVVILGYNVSDENDFTIADPLGGTIHSLKDYLGWYKPNARNTIESYCVVSGPVPTVTDGSAISVSSTVFPQLVHGSEQWDKTVDKYVNGKDPKQTQFEDLANVIGGIQSTATAANNANQKMQSTVAISVQQVENLKEQLAHSEQEREADKATYIAQVSALTPNSDATKNLITAYEARISGYQQKITTLMQDKHDLAVANAKLQAKQTPTVSTILTTLFPTFVSFLQRIKKQ